MNSKRIVWVLVGIIVILILALFFRTGKNGKQPETVSNGNNSTSTAQNTPKPTTTNFSQKETYTGEYVTLVSSSANEAIFSFAEPLQVSDVNGLHVQHCVINVSAVAEQEGATPNCKAASKENKFTLVYDAKKQQLTISSFSDDWGKGSGPFSIGCAACESAVNFTGLHTDKGALLPEKMILVY